MKRCQHCLSRKSTRARNLCHTCSRDPAVRALYHSAMEKRGIHNQVGLHSKTTDPIPTTTLPGKDKVDTLAARAIAGQHLFCNGDSRRNLN